jgi:hypothetical protein
VRLNAPERGGTRVGHARLIDARTHGNSARSVKLSPDPVRTQLPALRFAYAPPPPLLGAVPAARAAAFRGV